MKGTCGFLGFGVLESVTHIGESVLVKLRDGDLLLDSRITTLLLALIDAIRSLLQQIEENGADSGCDYSALVKDLTELNSEVNTTGDQTASDETSSLVAEVTQIAISEIPPSLAPSIDLDSTNNSLAPTEEIAATSSPTSSIIPEQDNPTAAEQHRATASTITEGGDQKQGKVADATVRVDVDLLDKLVNVVGELVLTRNQMLRYTSSLDDSTLIGALQRLNLITSDLQESVMRTRMQTVGTVWSKFPKLVHEVAQICKKQVRLEMEGKETELDKTLLEAIKDPLTHIIRNCVDHGLELPEVRVQSGKKAEGTIWLRATHESGNVIIEIVDDGRGIDPVRIKAKAIEKGLVAADRAAKMSEREVLKLIFLPGFSTAEQVTNISGRGVGMDVVRSNLQRINGSVDLQSTPGKGTTVRMKIPLTLAIVPALVIEHQGDRYAIPQAHLKEVVRVQNSATQHGGEDHSSTIGTSTQLSTQSRQGVERVNNSLVYRLRGKLIPLVDLRTELELNGVYSQESSQQAQTGVVNIAILDVDNRIFGLIIENVLDTQEIVVKPLGKQFSHVKCYAGSAVMGDGKVALILDVLGLEQRAYSTNERAFHSESNSLSGNEHLGDDANSAAQSTAKHFLVVEVGEAERMAIPLDNVARLETLKRSSLEKTGHVSVVQYRDRILRIIDLRELLGKSFGKDETSSDDYQLVVCKNGELSAGLVVNEIVDIVTQDVDFTSFEAGEYCSGTAVMGNKVTTLINADALLKQFH